MRLRFLWAALLLFAVSTAAAQPSRPPAAPTDPLRLPLNQPVFKITLAANALYELTYADLQAAGMAMDTVNPHQLVLMQRGRQAAAQWVGDADAAFEPGESLRFYGWAFAGSRQERQFVSDNVFWLWQGDHALPVLEAPNLVLENTAVQTTAVLTHTVEYDRDFFSTWTDRSSNFPNEPDAWYWDRLPRTGVGASAEPVTYTVTLPLPPVNTTQAAQLTVELFSRAKAAVPDQVSNAVTVAVNGADLTTQTWNGRASVNVAHTLPANALLAGDNRITLHAETPDVLYLNRITIAYPAQLRLTDAPLIFSGSAPAYRVANVAPPPLVWEITDPHRPTALQIDATDVQQNALTFGLGVDGNGRFIVTDEVKRPLTITHVMPTRLTPSAQAADWLAIAHSQFLAEAQRLAAYRAAADGFAVHVVDVADVIDQYGYGLPLPGAIRAYLDEAAAWPQPPRYVTLWGDATVNPRGLDCAYSCAGVGWDTDERTFVPTDLQFVDRYQGLIPTDQTLAPPGVAIGRIGVQTAVQAAAVVDKIIYYEQQQRAWVNWRRPFLFVADAPDAAGVFCESNRAAALPIPAGLAPQHLCLPANPDETAVAALQANLYAQLNETGVWLLAYRGHGSIQTWSRHGLLSVAGEDNSLGAWLNSLPPLLISADCLDGHFAWPGAPSVSESLLRHTEGGSVAHWASSGLGTDYEHTVLQTALFTGIFTDGARRLGDAILAAQAAYAAGGLHPAPLTSFNLQGDPALNLAWADLQTTYLPLLQRP